MVLQFFLTDFKSQLFDLQEIEIDYLSPLTFFIFQALVFKRDQYHRLFYCSFSNEYLCKLIYRKITYELHYIRR